MQLDPQMQNTLALELAGSNGWSNALVCSFRIFELLT
jgi:hypothetical protein